MDGVNDPQPGYGETDDVQSVTRKTWHYVKMIYKRGVKP